jgi:hypothetical protein
MSIINIEMMLWMRYKLNPFSMVDNLTIGDLTMYTNQLIDRLEEEQKDKTQDKLMKSLIAIRDVLNYMTFSQVSNN